MNPPLPSPITGKIRKVELHYFGFGRYVPAIFQHSHTGCSGRSAPPSSQKRRYPNHINVCLFADLEI